MKSKRLLVATDLSDASHKATLCAVELAKKTNSEIILLHIFELADVDEYARQMIATNFLSRDIKRQLQESVNEIESQHQLKANYLTKDGNLYERISEVLDETDSDILYIGTHGIHGVQHLIGSFLAKTINNAHKPTWVVQKQTDIIDYQDIFVYLDEFPTRALHPLTLELANLYNAKLHFVFTEPSTGYEVSEMVTDIEKKLRSENMPHTIQYLEMNSAMAGQLIKLVSEKPASLIVLNRNGKDAEHLIPILTNDKNIEVLCLDK